MKPILSSSDRKDFIKQLLLVFATVVVTVIIFKVLDTPQIRWVFMSTQQRINDTTSVSSLQADSSEIFNDDQLLLDSLELSWGTDRVNIKQALDNIAGVEGSVKWSISYAEAKLKNNPDLFTAFAHAENMELKKPKIFDITLVVNRQNKRFKVLKAVNNGKTLKGAMITISLALNGGYSQRISY